MFTAQVYLGGVPSPFDAYFVNRGIKTLHLRMKKHHENALEIAQWLDQSERIDTVWYPGLQSHPDFQTLKKFAKTAPGMITFTLKGAQKTK